MLETLPKALSPGLLLSLWDRYHKRVTVDLKIAWVPGSVGLEKRLFIVVRNNTDRNVVVHMFVWENTFRYRWIQDRAPRIIPPKPWFIVPPNDTVQSPIPYEPNGFVDPRGRYFGLGLADGRINWARRSQTRRVLSEYRKDFPGWRSHRAGLIFLKCREYGAIAATTRLQPPVRTR